MQVINTLGIACDIAGLEAGASKGPQHIENSDYFKQLAAKLQWQHVRCGEGDPQQLAALQTVIDYCQQAAQISYQYAQQQQPFLSVGGDHSCAIGTWSGVSQALYDADPTAKLGLIWVDAHLDAHTPETSETGNIHGMPVSHLLGRGNPALCHLLGKRQKLQPENLAMIGIRSYEAGEQALIEEMGVRVYDDATVARRGIDVVLQEARDHVMKGASHLGLSLDIDGFDPRALSAVCTPVPGGVDPEAFLSALENFDKSDLAALEIAEFCPRLDQNQATEQFMAKVVKQLLISEPACAKKLEAVEACLA